MQEHRQYLEAVNIVVLNSAARMAGLKFRNGEKTKAQIIDDLIRYPAIGRACMAVLARRERGETPAPMPAPKAPPMDWTDDAPSEAPAPVPAPQNSVSDDARTSRILYRLNQAEIAIAGHSQWQREAGNSMAAIRTAIETMKAAVKDLQQTRPIEFCFGDAPENNYRPEGLSHPMLVEVIRIFLTGENVMLVGPASSGKTTAAKQTAEALSKAFERPDYECIATGAVADSFALIGYKNAAGLYVSSEFRRAVEFGHLFLFDEVDASAADALLVINALDNGFIAFPDKVVPLHPHFRLLAGANTDGSGATMEYSGRTRMDGAFRDRFTIIDWEIDPRIEEFLSHGDTLWLAAVRAIRQFAKDREILDVVATARATRRGPKLLAQGMSREMILNITCKRGALRECWDDVRRLPAVAAYLRG